MKMWQVGIYRETGFHYDVCRNIILAQLHGLAKHHIRTLCFMEGQADPRAAAAMIACMMQAAPPRFYLESLRAKLFG